MKAVDESTRRARGFVVPDKILVASDLSDLDYLLPHALAQARACGAALTLVHVIPPSESMPLDTSAIPYVDMTALREEATATLNRAAEQARESGIPCEIVVSEGNPRDQLARIVHETHAGRIVAGTHGRGAIKRFFLGSVAHDILRSAEVPVCTIGPHAHSASAFGAPRKILHPVSLCAGYEDSARVALDLAQFYRADITLLHVLSRDVQSQHDADRIMEWTRSEMKRLVPEEAPLWTHPTIQVEIGGVVDQVLSAATEMDADLIVLGVGKDVTFWPIRGDDAVYEIIAGARCPVLSFRHTGERRE